MPSLLAKASHMVDSRVIEGGHHSFIAKGVDTGSCEEAGPLMRSTTRAVLGVRFGLAQGQPWWPVMVSSLLGHNTLASVFLCAVLYFPITLHLYGKFQLRLQNLPPLKALPDHP